MDLCLGRGSSSLIQSSAVPRYQCKELQVFMITLIFHGFKFVMFIRQWLTCLLPQCLAVIQAPTHNLPSACTTGEIGNTADTAGLRWRKPGQPLPGWCIGNMVTATYEEQILCKVAKDGYLHQ